MGVCSPRFHQPQLARMCGWRGPTHLWGVASGSFCNCAVWAWGVGSEETLAKLFFTEISEGSVTSVGPHQTVSVPFHRGDTEAQRG